MVSRAVWHTVGHGLIDARADPWFPVAFVVQPSLTNDNDNDNQQPDTVCVTPADSRDKEFTRRSRKRRALFACRRSPRRLPLPPSPRPPKSLDGFLNVRAHSIAMHLWQPAAGLHRCKFALIADRRLPITRLRRANKFL